MPIKKIKNTIKYLNLKSNKLILNDLIKVINMLAICLTLQLNIIYTQTGNLNPDQVKMLQERYKGGKLQGKTLEKEQDLNDKNLILPNRVDLQVYQQGLSNTDSLSNKEKYFGYDFFTRRDSIAFWENLPTPANYLMGPGDQIIISLWGETQIRQDYTISREGKIYDEKVGLLNIAGLSIEQTEKFLLNQFGRVYATLIGNNPKTFLDVSLGQLRSINVNFVGEVLYPGLHLIHPFSNLITGLIQAGGVDTTGSLRNIKIRRENKEIIIVDLYDYLLKGDSNGNIQLRDQDVILVPTRLSTVNIESGVIRPGIYEFINNENVNDLITIAGGMKPIASSTIGIERITPLKERKENNISLENYYFDYNNSADIVLQDGDKISILDIFKTKNYVEIIGQVKRPGKYFFKQGMKISDLVNLSGGLYDTTFVKSVYTNTGQIIRKNINSRFETVIKVKIKDLILGVDDSNIKLQNLDRFVIHSNLNFYERENVIIEGQVKIPGSYPILSDNESLSDIINRAGGISKGAKESGVSIYRLDKYFDLNQDSEDLSFLKNGRIKLAWENLDVSLMPGDSIIVKESPMTVVISGEVYNPGLVEYVKGRTLNNYLDIAGGITTEGDKNNIIIIYSSGVVKPKKWYSTPKINDGCQIIVNSKPLQEPFNITQFATNWTSIISSMITAVILSRQLES